MSTHLQIEAADQVRLHAVTAGTDGPVMLFLPGFPEFWGAWHRQLAEFSGDFRAVALDLRGYNLSDKPRGAAAYALPKIVADLRAVIRFLSPERPVVVVGHDWGGISAWALAREHPELIERLVIINAPHPAIFGRELKHNSAQRLASSYVALFNLPGVAELVLKAFRYAALRKMIFGITTKPEMFSEKLRAAYREAWSQPGALTGGLNYYRNRKNFRETIKPTSSWTIRVPTLVLWGEKDPALLQGNLVGLEDFVPKLTVRRHPAATHWIVHEEPQWVNRCIREFVTQR